MLRDIEKIFRHHFLYVVCSLAYCVLGGYLFGGTTYSFIVAGVVYILSVIIALSPLAEKMLRFFNGVRSIETNEEIEYLYPIFSEVMQAIPYEKNRKKWKIIELCIIDKLDVNACAIGRRTVAITRGAIKAFDEEQLKGVIAHEVAHIRNGDTVANMFLLVASGYFFLFVSLLKLIIVIVEKMSRNVNGKSVLRGLLKVIIFIFQSLMQLVLAMETRKREIRADGQAYQWGFGAELVSSLYLLDKISMGDYQNFKQRLTASHPRTTFRIANLERHLLAGEDGLMANGMKANWLNPNSEVENKTPVKREYDLEDLRTMVAHITDDTESELNHDNKPPPTYRQSDHVSKHFVWGFLIFLIVALVVPLVVGFLLGR